MQNTIFSNYSFLYQDETLKIEDKISPIIIGLVFTCIMIFSLISIERFFESAFFGIYLLLSIYLLIIFKKNTRIISCNEIEIDAKKMNLSSGEFQTKRLGVVGNRSHLLWFVIDGKVHHLFTFKSLTLFKSAVSQVEQVTGTIIDIEF